MVVMTETDFAYGSQNLIEDSVSVALLHGSSLGLPAPYPIVRLCDDDAVGMPSAFILLRMRHPSCASIL